LHRAQEGKAVSSAATGFGEGAKGTKALARTLAILGAACSLYALIASCFAVDVTEYGVVMRFGRVLRVISAPGLHLKTPFDSVIRIDRRLLLSRPAEAEFLSEDKKNIVVDSVVTWRVADPKRYLETLGERAAAEVRIADVIEGEIGAIIGGFNGGSFITTDAASSQYDAMVLAIRDRAARFVAKAYGIELVDVDIRRLSLPELNKEHVFDRMKAERGRIAKEHRSAGAMEAKRIIAEADRQRTDIAADAYAKTQRLRAEGDAEAARIYTAAFSRDAAFYKFLRTLQAYQQFLDDKTTLFLPADAAAAGILRYELQRSRSDAEAPAVTNRAAALPPEPQAANPLPASP
jgi:membrane protease subunit HflC